MGKHSKGKHAASKEKHSGLFGNSKESKIDTVSEEGKSEEDALKAKASSSGFDAEFPTEKMDLSASAEEDIVEDAADADEVAGAAVDSQVTDTQDTEDVSRADDESDEAIDAEDVADVELSDDYAPDDESDVIEEEVYDKSEETLEAASEDEEEKPATSESGEHAVIPFKMPAKHKKKFNPKRIAIACAIVVGFIGAIYLGGAAFFHWHMFPSTSVAKTDISLDDAETASAALEDRVGNYTFTIKGQGVNAVMTSEQADVTLESDAVADTVLQAQNIWAWPIEIFRQHDESAAVAEAMSANGLAEALAPAIAKANETAVAPENAKVVFNPNRDIFEIIPEKIGSTIDLGKAVEQVALGVLNLDKNIVLTNDSLVLPTMYRDDPKLATALATANDYLKTDVKLMLGDNLAAEVNAKTVGPWVTVTPLAEVEFNEKALSEWAQSVADNCNTVGTERTYIRPDGKEVTVKGGSYGWKINNNDLAAEITEAVNNRSVTTIDIPVIQSGNGFAALGSQDWGARYVDVDISEQYARFYDDAGTLIWETPIITGGNGHSTPTGVYSINRKQSPTVLIGQMTEEGVPEYESYVTYWMPFIGNSVGLHDATWQSSFGGNRYRQGFGSHGCVNLPFSAAQDLYSMIEIGDVVVVHY